jgi:hypothetical protein
MKTCSVCNEPLNVYGKTFIRIEIVQNEFKSIGNKIEFDEESIRNSIECCNLCTLTALKNVLIGNSKSASRKFDRWLEMEK